MNPLMSMLGGQLPNNYTNSNISGILQMMRTGNPQQIMQQMLSSNPKFAQFVEVNKGKSPEEIAKAYGLDFNQVRKMIGK